jgi:hypothetical protein
MGLITMISSGLLVLPTDSLQSIQYSALLISHELAHYYVILLVIFLVWQSGNH